MKPVLSEPRFHNEEVAFAYVESLLWPNGPVCKHCGEANRVGRLKGKTTRAGLYKCYACRKPFTVRMGTIFESSHVPLRVWLQVIHLICASKKGISTQQIHRTIGGSMTTAWFLTHRIRECMKEPAWRQCYICQTQSSALEEKPHDHRHLGGWTSKNYSNRNGL